MKAEGSQSGLADRVSAKLKQGGLLATTYGARNVRMDLDGPLHAAWTRGHIALGELWSYYSKYPYLMRLRDRSVLDNAVRAMLDDMAWHTEGYARAAGIDNGHYLGLTVPLDGSGFGQISDTTLLVSPALAVAQRDYPSPGPGPALLNSSP